MHDDPEYLARREAEIAREAELAAECRELVARLVEVAGELRWHSHDPYEAALGHVQSAQTRAAEGQPTPEPVRRRKPLPSRAVWDRDNWQCVDCGTHRNLTVDHIVPWSKGGSDDMDNLRTLCGPCNSRKGARV